MTLESEFKVSKGAKIRNRYNQVPHLAQDTNGIVTNSQLDTTNESQVKYTQNLNCFVFFMRVSSSVKVDCDQ